MSKQKVSYSKSDVSSTTSCCNNRTVFRLLTAAEKRSRFLKRLIRLRHMDFEYALWQAAYLLIAPQKVYRNFQYRKCARDQWARDDPAFLVILLLTVICTSVGFAMMMVPYSLLEYFKFVMWVLFIDFLASGLLVASIFWFISNRFLRISRGSGDPDVEWGYAFDIHLNAFFPLIIVLHLFQIPFIILINDDYWFSAALGNVFWLVALLQYNYITFLGYRALSFLQHTKALLYPMTVMLIVFLVASLSHWNFTSKLIEFYHYRVVMY